MSGNYILKYVLIKSYLWYPDLSKQLLRKRIVDGAILVMVPDAFVRMPAAIKLTLSTNSSHPSCLESGVRNCVVTWEGKYIKVGEVCIFPQIIHPFPHICLSNTLNHFLRFHWILHITLPRSLVHSTCLPVPSNRRTFLPARPGELVCLCFSVPSSWCISVCRMQFVCIFLDSAGLLYLSGSVPIYPFVNLFYLLCLANLILLNTLSYTRTVECMKLQTGKR